MIAPWSTDRQVCRRDTGVQSSVAEVMKATRSSEVSLQSSGPAVTCSQAKKMKPDDLGAGRKFASSFI